MGYSHYFYHRKEFTPPQWKLVKTISSALFDVCKQHRVLIVGPMGEYGTKPEITNDHISFNGEPGCETMYLARVPDPIDVRRHREHRESMKRSGYPIEDDDTICFGCCKTRCEPYDIAVVALLAAVDMVIPGVLKLSSDGEYEELKPGIDLATRLLSVLLPDREFTSSLVPPPEALAAPECAPATS